jgi:hypothetical protein
MYIQTQTLRARRTSPVCRGASDKRSFSQSVTRRRLRRGRSGPIWAVVAALMLLVAWDVESRVDATTYEQWASSKIVAGSQ